MSAEIDFVVKALALLWAFAVVSALLAILSGEIEDWMD